MTANNDVIVRLGDCPCPGAPHIEEHVVLEPVLTLPLGSAATLAWSQADGTLPAQQAALIGAYLPATIRSWSFLEDSERGPVPVPVTRENMERLIPWDKGGWEVSERADELYSAVLLAPLVRRWQQASAPTSTAPSMSASLPPGSATPSSSEPSLPAEWAGPLPVETAP